MLVVGSGGREHSLVWKLSQSDAAKHVFVAPGNPGTAAEKNVTNVPVNVAKNSEVTLAMQAQHGQEHTWLHVTWGGQPTDHDSRGMPHVHACSIP